MKNIKIFCYCLGGYFIFGGAAMYGVSSFFEFIGSLDSHVQNDIVFRFMQSVMNDLVGYGLWLVLFGMGYIFLGIFLEKLLSSAMWLHLAISVCLLIWGILCYNHFVPRLSEFYAMIPMPDDGFLEAWNRISLMIGLVSGAIQFVIPQFFLGRMIWKLQSGSNEML